MREAVEAFIAHTRNAGEAGKADRYAKHAKYLVIKDRSGAGLCDLGGIRLEAVRKEQVSEWQLALLENGRRGERLDPVSAKRVRCSVLACVRGAITELGRAGNLAAWKTKVYALERKVKDFQFMDSGQRAAVIAHADADAVLFFRGLAAMGVRPGELAARTVADLSLKHNTLHMVSSKGRRREWHAPIHPAALTVFIDAAKGKLPGAPLFMKAVGKPWGEHDGQDWNVAFKAAARRATAAGTRIDPRTTTYAFRHSRISEWLTDGIDAASIAHAVGTA